MNSRARDVITDNLQYKGYRSITFQLVVVGFVTGTVLLMLHYIDQTVWATSVLGLLAGYIARDGISKVAEAYIMKTTSTPDVKPDGKPEDKGGQP